MNFRAKTILAIIISLCIISIIYFLVPRRIAVNLYDSSIVFDEVIITKSYFDMVEEFPKLDDYKVTGQEDISKIRGMLYDIKVTPLLFRNNNLPGRYYMITFRNFSEQRKIKVKLIGSSYVENDFKIYKVKSKEAGEKLNTYIESLISNLK